jgi:hypothetical protein
LYYADNTIISRKGKKYELPRSNMYRRKNEACYYGLLITQPTPIERVLDGVFFAIWFTSRRSGIGLKDEKFHRGMGWMKILESGFNQEPWPRARNRVWRPRDWQPLVTTHHISASRPSSPPS